MSKLRKLVGKSPIFFCCLTEIIHFGHVVVEDTFESEIRKIFLGGIHHLDHPSVVPV